MPTRLFALLTALLVIVVTVDAQYYDFSDMIMDLSSVNTMNEPVHVAGGQYNPHACPAACGSSCEWNERNPDDRRDHRCPGGRRRVWDGCRCCKMCPRQEGEPCDRQNVCDPSKPLNCDFDSLTCVALPGRSCSLDGRVYTDGEEFKPTCDQECSCTDGAISCRDICNEIKLQRKNMGGCMQPKFLRRIGDCCAQWVCADDGFDIDTSKFYSQDQMAFVDRKDERPEISFEHGCMAQITKWSRCSESCGIGESTRINSKNKGCRLIKETRQCMVRPCGTTARKAKKHRSFTACRKTWKPRTAEHMELRGCRSVEPYRPRYCRSCQGLCCQPRSSKTISVEFECPNGRDNFFERFMWIKRCECYPGDCRHRTAHGFGIVMGADTVFQA